MRKLAFTAIFAALALSEAAAQKAENLPTQVTTVHLGDVRVRYLNFKWDEAAFGALEKGSDDPGAQRGWVIARLFPDKPIMWNGKQISGGNLLILNPAKGNTPLSFEVRVIDMRDVWAENPNVVAEPPEGTTLYSAPAQFGKVTEVADRLTIALSESEGGIEMSIHYGNRLAKLLFTR
jgi:hypothetical protein